MNQEGAAKIAGGKRDQVPKKKSFSEKPGDGKW